jgi:hypothetical protein
MLKKGLSKSGRSMLMYGILAAYGSADASCRQAYSYRVWNMLQAAVLEDYSDLYSLIMSIDTPCMTVT